jgi:formylglycine-generating enzyme required for sulfatase activity
MHKLLLATLFLLTLPELFGQKNPTEIYGTVPIDNTSSMDATEVTINEWIHFIINSNFNSDYFPNPASISNSTRLLFEDLKKQQNFEYIEIIGNSRVLKLNYGAIGFKITKKFRTLVEMDTNYFSINIPIVGISFMQAQKFCEWREAVVNKSKAVKIKVALPSIDVYKKVNINKDSLCKSELNCGVCKGYQINYLHPKCSPSTKKNKSLFETQGQGLLRVDSYWPSVLGLYNIQGNAAEMTSKEGIAVGGSFRHFANQSYNDQTQAYQKAEDWLGFRCLITLQ